MRPLPNVMVAPNGARLTKADHPALPISIEEVVACARECAAAGADGLHAHVRDAEQKHSLDAGLYRELLREMDVALPGFYAQITTEAVGIYTPAEQKSLIADLRPQAVSIALREITNGQTEQETQKFFCDCAEQGTEVQHILYDATDIEHLARSVEHGIIPSQNLAALLVIGRYEAETEVTPAKVIERATLVTRLMPQVDWALCAFGQPETDCLLQAHALGGKIRIGFENNRLNSDGRVAASNAERVREYLREASSAVTLNI